MSVETQFAVRVRRSNLESALRAVDTCVPRKAVPAILGCVLLEANGNNLSIRSTDLNQALRVTIPCSIDHAGALAVRSKKILSLIGSLADGAVRLTANSQSHMVIASGATKATMPAVPGSSFPSSFTPCTSWIARFAPGDLSGLIECVLPALGDEEEYGLALSSALLRHTPAGVLLVATDRYLLSRAELRSSTPTPEDRDILLPRRLLRTLQSLFPSIGNAQVDLGLTSDAVFFRGGNYMLAARRVEGSFPAFEKAIPSWTREIRVSALDLQGAVNRLKGFVDHEIGKVHFDVRGQILSISAQTEGSYLADEELNIGWTGKQDVSFCLRAKGLLTCLRAMRHQRDVIFGIPDSLEKYSAVTLTPGVSDAYNSLYLLTSAGNHRGTDERKETSATKLS
jgi:DNA polymerase-3 subunit beta